MNLNVFICYANKNDLIFHMIKDVFQKVERYSSQDCTTIQIFHKNDQNLLNENICESIIQILFQPFHKGLYKYDLSSQQLPFEIALGGWL